MQLQILTNDLRKPLLPGRLCRQQRHHQKKRDDGAANGRRLDGPGHEGRRSVRSAWGILSLGATLAAEFEVLSA